MEYNTIINKKWGLDFTLILMTAQISNLHEQKHDVMDFIAGTEVMKAILKRWKTHAAV